MGNGFGSMISGYEEVGGWPRCRGSCAHYPLKMGAPGASLLGTWDSTDIGRPVLLFLDFCSDSL